MSFKKPTSIRDFALHLAVVLGATAAIIIGVFYIWLPLSTNHGETITVPDVQGMTVDELGEFLGNRDLRYEATADSSYSPDFPPLAVLRQVPAPNTQVKENRKIYVTLNSERPPKVRMPKVQDLSLKGGMMVLKSYELKLGDLKYIPDNIFGTIHEARMDGRVVLEGERIEKGSKIDLVVGNGYGNTIFQSPNLIGLEREEAEVAIIGSGLRVGKVQFTDKGEAGYAAVDSLGNDILDYRRISPGSIQQQYPRPGRQVSLNDRIDIWIYKPDSLASSSTILDN